MDLFSLKKVDRRNAIIHAFTKTPQNRKATKGRTDHATWTWVYFVQSSMDDFCKYIDNVLNKTLVNMSIYLIL